MQDVRKNGYPVSKAFQNDCSDIISAPGVGAGN